MWRAGLQSKWAMSVGRCSLVCSLKKTQQQSSGGKGGGHPHGWVKNCTMSSKTRMRQRPRRVCACGEGRADRILIAARESASWENQAKGVPQACSWPGQNWRQHRLGRDLIHRSTAGRSWASAPWGSSIWRAAGNGCKGMEVGRGQQPGEPRYTLHCNNRSFRYPVLGGLL